jgi:hypothetical protein
MGVSGNVTRAKRGLAIVLRTVWFAGILLLVLLGLLAVKMVTTSAAASDTTPSDTTSALTQGIPAENTLTEADRGVATPEVEGTPLLPVESNDVRAAHAEFRPSEIMRKHAPIKAVAAKPRATAAKPAKVAEVKACRPRDPIARFLIAAKLVPPCAG